MAPAHRPFPMAPKHGRHSAGRGIYWRGRIQPVAAEGAWMIGDFHFLRPLWLLALIAPPLIVFLAAHSENLRRRWKGMMAPHLLDALVVEPGQRSRARPSWFLATV